MISLTTLTATSSLDRLAAPSEPVPHTVAASRLPRPAARRRPRTSSWLASSVVTVALLGGVAAGLFAKAIGFA
jgi:hypothetical protein